MKESHSLQIALAVLALLGIGIGIGAVITIALQNSHLRPREVSVGPVSYEIPTSQPQTSVVNPDLPTSTTVPQGSSFTPPAATLLSHEERLQMFLNDLNTRYPRVGFYLVKYDDKEHSFLIGISKPGNDLQSIILPEKTVAGDYVFHYWDGQDGGDVGHPGETIDPYGSDPQTGLIGTMWFLP